MSDPDVADDSAVDIPTVPPKKITIDEMIDHCLTYIGDLDRNVAFFKERPETCDHRPAARKAQAFRQILSTLELVQLHEAGFVNLIKSARPLRKK